MISLGICNSETNDIILDRIEYHIKKYCALYSTEKLILEPALIKAICKQETGFKPYSIRYEKHLRTNQSYCGHIPEKHKDNKLSFSSLGIMQVLYGTATWQGFKGDPEALLLLDNSIRYGVMYIKYLIKKHWNIEKVISSYNAGSPRYKNKMFVNQLSYVNPVLKFYKRYGGKIKVNELIK